MLVGHAESSSSMPRSATEQIRMCLEPLACKLTVAGSYNSRLSPGPVFPKQTVTKRLRRLHGCGRDQQDRSRRLQMRSSHNKTWFHQIGRRDPKFDNRNASMMARAHGSHIRMNQNRMNFPLSRCERSLHNRYRRYDK